MLLFYRIFDCAEDNYPMKKNLTTPTTLLPSTGVSIPSITEPNQTQPFLYSSVILYLPACSFK